MGRKRIAAERQSTAKPCAAALVLQGTQPRSIAQAPNSSNACNHATQRVGAGCALGMVVVGVDMTVLASPRRF